MEYYGVSCNIDNKEGMRIEINHAITNIIYQLISLAESGLGTVRNYSFVDFVEDKNVGKYA